MPLVWMGREFLVPTEFNTPNISALMEFMKAGKHISYLDKTYNDKLRFVGKGSGCQAEIYMNPPRIFSNSAKLSFLYVERYGALVLKHPEVYLASLNPRFYNWKRYFVQTEILYSVLVYESNTRELHRDPTVQSWMHTSWGDADWVKTYLILMVWQPTKLDRVIYLHCRFCDPCMPYLMVSVSIHMLPRYLPHLDQSSFLELTRYPTELDVVLPAAIPRVAFHKEIYGSRKLVLKTLQPHLNTDLDNVPFMIHTHLLRLMIPINITLNVMDNLGDHRYITRWVRVPGCNVNVVYVPHLQIRIWRLLSTIFARFSEPGLVLHTEQFRFVTCIIDRKFWLHRIIELVSPFDFITWSLIAVLFILLSVLLTCITSYNKKVTLENFLFVVTNMLAALVDQGYVVVTKPQKQVVYFIVLIPLLALTVLVNAYKGDNINRLTMPVEQVPFDTFDSLVNSSFTIFSMPQIISPDRLFTLYQHYIAKGKLVEARNHEMLPVVSEIWYNVMLRWGNYKEHPDSNLVSARALYYLNNSRVYLGINDITKVNYCNKTAVILRYHKAKQITVQSRNSKTRRNYLGKTILHENLIGYYLFGQFPSSLERKIKYFFETGIVAEWKGLLEHMVDLLPPGGNFDDEQLKTGTFVLLAIPFVGWLLSLVVFVFGEVGARLVGCMCNPIYLILLCLVNRWPEMGKLSN